MAANLDLANSPAVATAFADAATIMRETFDSRHAARPRINSQIKLMEEVLTAFRKQTATMYALTFDLREDMTPEEVYVWVRAFKIAAGLM